MTSSSPCRVAVRTRTSPLSYTTSRTSAARTTRFPSAPARLFGSSEAPPFGLSSWLRGEPGEPASAGEQAGFSERNAASYASFPADTTLRLLRRETVGGKTLSLLGFRNSSSLCLRLIRADLPAGRGENQCVTLRELERYPAPALVAARARKR